MKQNKVVKKGIYILLLGLMLCVGACSKKETKENTKVPADTTSTPEVSEETGTPEPDDGEKPTQEPEKESEDNQETTEEPQFLYDGEPIDAVEFRASSQNLAFDRPMYQFVREGRTQVFNRAGSLFIAYSVLKEEHPELTAKDVMASKLNEDFFNATKYYYTGSFSQELVMDKTEDMTINGVDCMRFEGKIKVKSEENDPEREKYAVGYTFLKDNMPSLLIGVVVEDDQTQLHKDEVTHNVDEIIKTLRDKE